MFNLEYGFWIIDKEGIKTEYSTFEKNEVIGHKCVSSSSSVFVSDESLWVSVHSTTKFLIFRTAQM